MIRETSEEGYKDGVKHFNFKREESFPQYLLKEKEYYEHRKLMAYLRCYDCGGDDPIENADSFMCRKVHGTVFKLANRGWSHKDILRECKIIYGNDIMFRHYEPPPPIVTWKFLIILWGFYMIRAKYFRVRWEKLVKYKSDRYY
ncbi:unnamed protein product [Blepharisma stoltei]|uniref:Uncharacterized protein n=1 Tax=Blepharisma stoltei TaxID=1481888 RepID=A0AAU9JSW9_9CILI|nr:unnamed protein product [Blepharisma stoltei]